MLNIQPHPSGRGYQLETVQELPAKLETVFEFFSDAFQLESLTPPWLNFHVLTPAPIQISTGTLIDYRLRIHGIPLRWRTLISDWDPPHRFVDEQLKGPYRRWHHTHLFEPTANGTRVTDRVHYEVPGGSLIHRWFVAPDLHRIFAYRQAQLAQRWPG